ncbi:hypothetical protein F5879DRAFT_995196 [Lentinula edodes]|nr:hypothetical protein F5879DRAFT_995196 [Lentinula edodes]
MAPSSISSVFGSGLVGIVLAATLFGVYSSQVYSYYNNYSKDKAWMKLLVALIWVILSLQYALNLHAIYTYLIDDFGQDAKLAVANWDWLSYAVLTSVTSILVQLFFARRLFYLLRNKIAKWAVPGIISAFSLIGFIFGVFITQSSIHMKLFSSFTKITWGIDLWLGANVTCDICITLCMCYALHTSRTGIKSTDRLINKLMAYSVQTGAVTSFTEIFCLATFTASGFHFGHILVVFPLSGLYANSFLANLHARHPNTPSPPSSDQFIDMSVNRSYGGSQIAKMVFSPNDECLDETSPDADDIVKPAAPHNAYDAGAVISGESDISSRHVQIQVNDGTESYPDELYVQIRALVKAAAKAWGEKDVSELKVKIHKPSKKSVEPPTFPIAFRLIGDMKDCEPAIDFIFLCVGKLDSMSPPNGIVVSLITKKEYDTKKAGT